MKKLWWYVFWIDHIPNNRLRYLALKSSLFYKYQIYYTDTSKFFYTIDFFLWFHWCSLFSSYDHILAENHIWAWVYFFHSAANCYLANNSVLITCSWLLCSRKSLLKLLLHYWNLNKNKNKNKKHKFNLCK